MTSDPRRLLALDGRAARALEGRLPAETFVDTEPMTLVVGSALLRPRPDEAATPDDQLLFGEAFDVLQARDGWAFGQARRDGYVGWAPEAALAPGAPSPTHWVKALRTLAFPEPTAKSPPVMALSMNSLVRIEDEEGAFARAAGAGWLPSLHLAPVGVYEDDPAGVALRFVGAPYLWGGRESLGLDCSGLVQQALYACGLGCPRDADQQEAELGRAAPSSDTAGLRRNDLVFWPGHVGLMVDAARMVHASGAHMAVVVEGLADRLARTGEPARTLRRL